MTELTLRALLNPVEWPAFIQKYWQREPLHIERRNREFYTGWVSSEEVDYLLATHVGKAGFPLSVIGGQSAPKGNSNPRREGWTPEKVYERFAEGATIRIGNMPAYSASIRRLACSFEALLNTDIGVNLYMTPRNAQAFQAHYDNHDVFIVQIEGEKTWKLF
jgi:ribosomal protein L16 Arg81 hydroxylase